MRPVYKGLWPTRPDNAAIRLVFTDWTNAKKSLVERTGEFCHLCEIYMPMGLAVEHIMPKVHFGLLSDKWDNFLLICTACNSRKHNDIPARPYKLKYYWPHLHNTLLAFQSPFNGPSAFLVTPSSALNPDQLSRANATINLYKLDQKLLLSGEPDPRYRRKFEIGSMAMHRYLDYKRGQCTLQSVTENAKANGFFTLWLEIFKNERPVVDALLDLPDFKLDRAQWFDAQNVPQGRNGTKIDPI